MKEEHISLVGHIKQIAGVERLKVLEGKAKGNEIVRVRSGSGLAFDIQVDRAMDIGICEYKGVNMAWLSPGGFSSPCFYDEKDRNWEKTFGGGMVTTCGLRSAGKPSQVDGEHFGLHGKVSHIPTEQLSIESEWKEGSYIQRVSGIIRENISFADTLELKRTIETTSSDPSIRIYDEITNHSYNTNYFALLYHINIGFPLLTKTTEVILPSAEQRIISGALTNSKEPSVILYKLEKDYKNIIIKNNFDRERLSLEINWNQQAMPQFTQWNYVKKGVNVMGIEPGNVSTEGREKLIEKGEMPQLKAFETKKYQLELKFG